VLLHLPLTPNVIIDFYCLAIILVTPKVYEALGIGIVAGILSMLITSSIFPPANLVSESVGALVCFGIYALTKEKLKMASPGITTFIATLASGFTFSAIAIVMVSQQLLAHFPQMGNVGAIFILVFTPIVVITAICNAIIVQILYIPSSRVIMRG
jgi:energy-coupling factor transport system ATP-binding protein